MFPQGSFDDKVAINSSGFDPASLISGCASLSVNSGEIVVSNDGKKQVFSAGRSKFLP